MPAVANLNPRHQHILWATVRHYIATAEPVGSKALAEGYDLSFSSATIRNIMGNLEKSGFLYQPHTSAGRVPSDSGYRTYVDHLMIPDTATSRKVEQLLNHQIKLNNWTLEAILQRAAQILATLSGYIVLITFPQQQTAQLRHLQLIQVSPQQLMLIIVTDSYQSQSILINAPQFLKEKEHDPESVADELRILSNFLNTHLQGRSLSELANLDWQKIDQEFQDYADFLKGLTIDLSEHYSQLNSASPMMIRGISEVLRQPEFSQLDQVQMLLHLLEEQQEQLFPLVFQLANQDSQKRVQVKIGSENNLESMQSCTLICANYCQAQTPIGSVGVIGPKRMLYENAIALVQTTADYLSETLSN